MWWQTILTAVAISYVICVLLLSGLQKEDLDASTLEKLGRHNVNIYDKNNDMQRQACLLNSTYSGTGNNTQDHKTPVDQNVALNTTSNMKGDSKEVNITEYLKVEIRVPDNLDVQSILRNTTGNKTTDSLMKQLKLLDENLKPSDVIDNLTKLGSVSKIEENNGLQIEYNMKNQPDLENMMNFWTKLTHNTKTVVTKIDTTSVAPNTTKENIVSTTTIKSSQNNGYVHSREMEYISRILAEYMASQTVPTTTERVYMKKNNTNIIFRTREIVNKTTMREKNNSTENKNHVRLSKNVNNHTNFSPHSLNGNMKQELGETEYMPHKILFDSHQESIQVYYPHKVDEAKSDENQQEMKNLPSKEIPYFEQLFKFGIGATSPKPTDNINPIRFLDNLLQNNNNGIPTPYTDTTTDSNQPFNQHKTDQYDIMKDAEKNIFDRENYSETVDHNTRPPIMKLSDEEIRLNNQYKELLSNINKLKRQKKLRTNNGSKENPMYTNNGDDSKIINTLPSESEEVPVLRVRKLKHYQNYDFKAMLPSIKNSKRNLNLQTKKRMNNIIEMNKSQFENIRIYEDAYKNALNQPGQDLISGINNYQSDAEPVINNIEQDSNVAINGIQLEKPGETKETIQNQYSGTNYYQFSDTGDKIKRAEAKPTLDLNENFMQFNIMPSLKGNPNQFKSSSNKYQLKSETDLMKKSNLYVKDNQFNIMPLVQNKLNNIQDIRNNQYQFTPRAINMKAPNSDFNRNKLLAAVTIQSYRIQESRNNYKTKTKPDIMKSSNLYSNSNQFQIMPALQNKLNRVPNFKTNNYQYVAGPKTTKDNEQNSNLNENQFNMKPGVANPTNEIQDSRTNYQINSDPNTITNSNLDLNGNQLNVKPVLKNEIEQLQNYRNIPFNFNGSPENINNAEQSLNSRLNPNEFNTMSMATQLSNQIQDTRNKYQINAGPNIINSLNSEVIQSQSMMKPKVTQFNQVQDSKTNYQMNTVKDNAVKNPENPSIELNENQFIMKPTLIKQTNPVQDSRNDYKINGVPDSIKTINFSINENQFKMNPTAGKQLNPVQDSGTNFQINNKPDIMKNPNSQNNKNVFNTHPEIKINLYRNPNLVLNEINTTPTVTKRSNRIQIKQPDLINAIGSVRNPEPKLHLEINDNSNIPIDTRQPNPNQDPRNQFNTEPVIIVYPDRNQNLKVNENNNNPAESKQSNRIQDPEQKFNTRPVIIENLEQNPNLKVLQNNKPPEKRQSNPLKTVSSDLNSKVEINNNQLNTVPAVTKRSNQIQDYKNTSAVVKQNRNVEIFNKRIQRLQQDVNILKEQQNLGMNTNKPESISPNVINEIAERVKQIVLQDIRKEVASTKHTTMLTTTSEDTTVSTTVATRPSTPSTVASTTVTTEKATTVKDAVKEANTLMMQKLMQMFDEFKTMGKSVQSTITSTSIPLKSTVKYKETQRPFAGYTLATPPPAFNPYIIKVPPIFANPIEVSPYGPGMVPIPISSGTILPKIPLVHMPKVIKQHNINGHQPAAITLQTNSDEIAPLAIQISKPLRLINQHIVVTTKNPFDKLKMEQERESKKRIDEKYSGISNENKHRDKHLLHSDTTKRVRFADNPKRHEYSDKYFSKARFDKDKPNYKHEYGDMGHRENFGRLKFKNRPEGYRYPGYFEGIGHAGGIAHFIDYNRPGSQQDEINRQERVYGSNSNGHPRTHYETTKFHERLERIENWPRNGWKEYKAATTENCSDYIPPRQQVPMNKVKKRTRFDDTHFTNFLKSQQKVTDMLEKILASNMKATAPRSIEVSLN